MSSVRDEYLAAYAQYMRSVAYGNPCAIVRFVFLLEQLQEPAGNENEPHAILASHLRLQASGCLQNFQEAAANFDRYLEYCVVVPWAGAVVNPVNIRWSAAEKDGLPDMLSYEALIASNAGEAHQAGRERGVA